MEGKKSNHVCFFLESQLSLQAAFVKMLFAELLLLSSLVYKLQLSGRYQFIYSFAGAL